MIIDILLPLSLIFIMFTLGISLTIQDFKNVVSNPKVFIIGIINQMVVLPVNTFLIILIFNLPGELAVGLMILACCPGGVTSNILTKLAKGDTALSISYTAIVSIVTVITLPLIVGFSIQYFMGSSSPKINILLLGLTMFIVTTVPVSLGLYVNMRHPSFSSSFYQVANKISIILFVLIVFGALMGEWSTFISNLRVLGLPLIVLIASMLFIGYNSAKWLNVKKEQAITIAIESGVQNATVGITIGNLILNEGFGLSILSFPSGVYGILMYCVCIPFVFWTLNKKEEF